MEKTVTVKAQFKVNAESELIFEDEELYQYWAKEHSDKDVLLSEIKKEFETSLADKVEITDFDFVIEE